MSSKKPKSNVNFGLEFIASFIKNIDHDIGLCNAGLSTGDEDKDWKYLFPSLNRIFGIHKNVMSLFFYKLIV